MGTTTTLTQIHQLEERYPFTEEELEILIRCHDQMDDDEHVQEDFLLRLALASPYSYYFLPGDELKDRVTWIEDHILPMGFASQLRAAISADPFVTYANQGQNPSLERFLEGIADTGRRGPKEALRVLYELVGDQPSAEEIMDLCFRLTIACDALIAPSFDKEEGTKRLAAIEEATKPLVKSLTMACKKEEVDFVPMKGFTVWAEKMLPLLSVPLSTFVHHLIFHQIQFPESRTPFVHPKLETPSNIFEGADSPLLVTLSLISPKFSGKMSRLYSSDTDGRSFNRLEWALHGYDGPTLMVVRTEKGAVIGAFTETVWKEALNFYGTGDCFLFQLQPEVKVIRSTGPQDHFMYMHYGELHSSVEPGMLGLPHGIGFGGSVTSKPRFFIPDSLEHCSAGFLDKTFETGDILQEEELERFEIAYLEVWGVGGEEAVQAALNRRAMHRELAEAAIYRARVVTDKSQFVKDLESGLTPSKLYDHKATFRGRHEFRVDEGHGGYKIDQV